MQKKIVPECFVYYQYIPLAKKGYIDDYDGKGITDEQIVKEEDIYSNSEFTGYHKKVTIKDYVLIVNDSTKKQDIVKEITTEIFYKLKFQAHFIPSASNLAS